jgi:septal ring-binding cell division protein DamX
MALALALLSLLMMTALLLPLLSMSSSEVQIAANLTAAAQARQCAEAGLEYALSENVPPGVISSTIDVNGNVVCSFVVTPATVSPTEVALTSTSTLTSVRPGSSTASQNFVLDVSTGRWSAKAGTFRGR